MARLSEILTFFEGVSPIKWAESWDNCGLITGDARRRVKRVLVSLDVTDLTIDEALAWEADLIISHHPLFLKPMLKIDPQTLEGGKLIRMIKNDIALLSLHTNMDITPGGVGDMLAAALGLCSVRGFYKSRTNGFKKLVTFVPPEYVERVSHAVFEAGAGRLGNYTGCGFRTKGEGSFIPGTGANPFIGESGQPERVTEIRFETVLPSDLAPYVVAAMKAAHPYEEPAYDLFDDDGPKEELFLGRIGELREPMEWEELLSHIKKALSAPGLRFSKRPSSPVKTLAVAGGSCAFAADAAFLAGADAFLCGDLKYHDFLDFSQKNRTVIDAGHFATENVICSRILRLLEAAFDDVEVKISELGHDCVEFYV